MMQCLVGDSGEFLIVILPSPFLTSQGFKQLPSHHQKKTRFQTSHSSAVGYLSSSLNN